MINAKKKFGAAKKDGGGAPLVWADPELRRITCVHILRAVRRPQTLRDLQYQLEWDGTLLTTWRTPPRTARRTAHERDPPHHPTDTYLPRYPTPQGRYLGR